MGNSPIAFFAYNRPEHCLQALESLAANEGAAESELFIFCDGPKGRRDHKAVEEVRAAVGSRKWCKTVHIIEREKNWGLARSIISGVTETVNRHGRIIVLEDDLVLSPQFLNFMNDALEFYKDQPKVMHISGYMFPVKGQLPEAFFYRGASCWGWGTWKRAWNQFESDAQKHLDRLSAKALRYEFDIQGSTNFYSMLRDHSKGRINSWAIRWYASVFLNGGLCLHPGTSMTNNIGHDGTGVHCMSTEDYQVMLAEKMVSHFPSKACEDDHMVRQMVQFYRSIKKPLHVRAIGWLGRRLRRNASLLFAYARRTDNWITWLIIFYWTGQLIIEE
jgi:hypothetical protein